MSKRPFGIAALACLVLTGTLELSRTSRAGARRYSTAAGRSKAFVEVAAGGQHTVARRSDGSVVAWGYNDYGQCNVPALPAGLTYVEVAAGSGHTVARRSDGSVVAWGDNGCGQCNVPALPAGLTYVEIAAGDWPHGGAPERRLRRRVGEQLRRPVQRAGASGRAHLRRGRGGQATHGGAAERRLRRRVGEQRLRPVQRPGASGRAHLRRDRGGQSRHTVARRSDGSVVAWGDNYHGQCNVPALPAGLTYVEVAAGGTWHTVARRSDGSVVAWGDNSAGQCNVPALPAGLTYVEVAAGACTRWRAGATAPSSRGGPTPTASATFRRFRPGSRYVEVAAGDRSHGGASERRLRRRVGGQRRRPVQRAGASGRAHLRRGRGGRPSHGGAAERRLRRRVGVQRRRPVQRSGASGRAHLRRGRGGRRITRWRVGATAPSSRGGTTPIGQCNVPALPAGLTYVEVAAGDASHGGAPERRLRRRVGGERLRPVQRAGASGRAHLRRGRGGHVATRWRGGATAPSSRGGTTPTASATSPRLRPGSPTSRSRRATSTRWRAGATARSSRGGTTPTASATCRRSPSGSPTSTSRRAVTRWRATASPRPSCLSAPVAVVRECRSSLATRRASGATVTFALTNGTPNVSGSSLRRRRSSRPDRLRRGCELQVDRWRRLAVPG